MLSVVIPAYNEEQMIKEAAKVVSGILCEAGIEYELLFVDDGSSDATWNSILAARETDENISGIHFSRNFGKEAAMFAGLEKAKGDCVAVMDCDLQHPPKKLVEMYRLWQEGYEVVEGIKITRGQETALHKKVSGIFYKLMTKATGCDMSNASDFKLLDRKVVDTLNSLPERNVFFRALSFWTGYKRTTVEFDVQERTVGTSKWSTAKLFKYAITNVMSFTLLPLHIIMVLGVAMIILALIIGIIAIAQKIAGTAEPGFTTVILLILFTSGVVVVCLGIIAAYVAKIYDEIKGRPRYIISEYCTKEK